MARNTRQTGKKAASAAAKVLSNPKSTKAEKLPLQARYRRRRRAPSEEGRGSGPDLPTVR